MSFLTGLLLNTLLQPAARLDPIGWLPVPYTATVYWLLRSNMTSVNCESRQIRERAVVAYLNRITYCGGRYRTSIPPIF
jgi:hypothetical protein